MPVFTEQQQAVIAAIRRGESVDARAVAGSGKTTTLVEALQGFNKPALTLAFNKRNAEDLAARVPPTVHAKTMNALGHAAWATHISRRLTVQTDKTRSILREVIAKKPILPDQFIATTRLVSLAKAFGITPGTLSLPPPDIEEWRNRADERDIPNDVFDECVENALDVLRISVNQAWKGIIDFDDQLYMPVLFNARFPRYAAVFVDEAQDLSTLQHIMVERIKSDQIGIIGDPNQAIYSFRGASSNSYYELAARFGTTNYPLTLSFRCPKVVAAEAMLYVPDFSVPDTAIEGEIIEATSAELKPGAILCRYNAPLVKLAFRALREGKPFNYLGRDFLSGILAIHKRAPTPSDLDAWLQIRLREAKTDGAKDRSHDQYHSLLTLHEASERMQKPIEFIIKSMMEESRNANATILSTVHKAKGLEWERVTFLNYAGAGANAGDEEASASASASANQENNINYVGVTRAQHSLTLIRRRAV